MRLLFLVQDRGLLHRGLPLVRLLSLSGGCSYGRIYVFLQPIGVFTSAIALFVCNVTRDSRVPRVGCVTSRDGNLRVLPFC
jgi:hypothetical protein